MSFMFGRMKVLFFNHKKQNCGVYQYGKRLYDAISKTTEIQYIYKEIDDYKEYAIIIEQYRDIDYIFYNYCCSPMGWLKTGNIQRRVPNIAVTHEGFDANIFDIICDNDPTVVDSHNYFGLPRPIYENIDIIISQNTQQSEIIDSFINAYTDTDIPIFGSFGFGFENKGFHKIITMVNEQYNEAVIKLVIAPADYGPNIDEVINMKYRIESINKKSGIKLMISNEFFSNENILKFLKSNTMNIFLYDKMLNRKGISSTIDYAISVKKPLGISDSYMFHNIYSDKICLYKTSIRDCLAVSVDYCATFVEKYSHKNMISKLQKIIYS